MRVTKLRFSTIPPRFLFLSFFHCFYLFIYFSTKLAVTVFDTFFNVFCFCYLFMYNTSYFYKKKVWYLWRAWCLRRLFQKYTPARKCLDWEAFTPSPLHCRNKHTFYCISKVNHTIMLSARLDRVTERTHFVSAFLPGGRRTTIRRRPQLCAWSRMTGF